MWGSISDLICTDPAIAARRAQESSHCASFVAIHLTKGRISPRRREDAAVREENRFWNAHRVICPGVRQSFSLRFSASSRICVSAVSLIVGASIACRITRSYIRVRALIVDRRSRGSWVGQTRREFLKSTSQPAVVAALAPHRSTDRNAADVLSSPLSQSSSRIISASLVAYSADRQGAGSPFAGDVVPALRVVRNEHHCSAVVPSRSTDVISRQTLTSLELHAPPRRRM